MGRSARQGKLKQKRLTKELNYITGNCFLYQQMFPALHVSAVTAVTTIGDFVIPFNITIVSIFYLPCLCYGHHWPWTRSSNGIHCLQAH